MKRILLMSFASVALAGSAAAADLPARLPVKAPPLMAPAFTWTGGYFGANVGYGWGRQKGDTTFIGGPFGLDARQNMNGVFAGGQGGYNWQIGQFVLGIENDIQWSDQHGSSRYCLGDITCPALLDAEQKLRWFGTARSRIGITAWDNRVLFYGTAGAAYGETRSSFTVTVPGVAGFSAYDSKSTRAGWTAGAGIEWAFDSNWSAKVEYLHIDLGHENTTLGILGIPVVDVSSKFTDDLVRVGVNYRFSFGGAPVVARY